MAFCTFSQILAIRGIPGFVEAKECMLPMAHKLAHLPESYLDENLTDEKSFYNAGCPGSETDRAHYPESYPCNL